MDGCAARCAKRPQTTPSAAASERTGLRMPRPGRVIYAWGPHGQPVQTCRLADTEAIAACVNEWSQNTTLQPGMACTVELYRAVALLSRYPQSGRSNPAGISLACVRSRIELDQAWEEGGLDTAPGTGRVRESS